MRELTIHSDKGLVAEKLIKDFKNQINHKLPPAYLDLIKAHNELRVEENLFTFKNYFGVLDQRDISFIGFGDSKSVSMEDVQKYVSEEEHNGHKGLVAFGLCANGDYICFDYRADSDTQAPAIVLLYRDDCMEDETGSATMIVNEIADSFESFAELLYDPDNLGAI